MTVCVKINTNSMSTNAHVTHLVGGIAAVCVAQRAVAIMPDVVSVSRRALDQYESTTDMTVGVSMNTNSMYTNTHITHRVDVHGAVPGARRAVAMMPDDVTVSRRAAATVS